MVVELRLNKKYALKNAANSKVIGEANKDLLIQFQECLATPFLQESKT